ncbi:MAG: GNAT family N-acetyltransferase [Eubacterium sp.]
MPIIKVNKRYKPVDQFKGIRVESSASRLVPSYRNLEAAGACAPESEVHIDSEEYSWRPSFSDYAASIALNFAKKPGNDREELFIAVADGKPVGCIMLCETDNHDVGQLRLFAVEKEYRKLGIGSALLQAFFQKAKSSGYQKIILWTASPLTAAIRQYKKMGFQTTDWRKKCS